MSERFTPEQKEKRPKLDFKQIFQEKLESITPLSDEDSEWEAVDFRNLGIKIIKRKAPAIIFSFPKNKEQLWATDPKNIKSNYPHDKVRAELENFLKTNHYKPGIISYATSAYIMQDDKNKLYLFFDGPTAERKKEEADRGYYDGVKKYDDLIQRYGIEKMIGQFPEITTEGDTTTYGYKMVPILDRDIIGKIRENDYLRSFAKKYGMSISQFMRFRIRAISAREAAIKDKEASEKGMQYLIDLDTLAKEVLLPEEGHL